jgi:hypothetical protein
VKSLLRLVIVLTFLLLVTACSPAIQTSPAPPASATPLPPTSQPTASQSTPTPALETPVVVPTFQLSSACVLTAAQRSRLETVSRKWLASTDEQALQVARDLDYIGINGQPATMCGPLSVAILQEAGLADPNFDRANFYLLNPRPGFGDAYVESLFPSSRYFKIVEERVIKEVDYQTDPLCPGDFLYLFAGESGSYEHMLVVTRVDEAGRAYTVTNIDFREGYRVEELMLYDPAQPGVGMFTDWTSSPHPQIGRTGYDGFWLWRLKAPITEPSPAAVELAAAIDSIIDQTGGIWHIQFKEVGGDVLYSRLADTPIHPASFNKLALAALFLNTLEAQGVDVSADYLSNQGIGGRSFDQLLRAMLLNFEEYPSELLQSWFPASVDPNDAIRDLGYGNTLISPRQTTVTDISRLLEDLYIGELLQPAARQFILDLLVPSEGNPLNVVRNNLEPGDVFYAKHGSVTEDHLTAAEIAIFTWKGKLYSLTLVAYPDVVNNDKATYASLQDGVEQIAGTIMDYLKDQ